MKSSPKRHTPYSAGLPAALTLILSTAIISSSPRPLTSSPLPSTAALLRRSSGEAISPEPSFIPRRAKRQGSALSETFCVGVHERYANCRDNLSRSVDQIFGHRSRRSLRGDRKCHYRGRRFWLAETTPAAG